MTEVHNLSLSFYFLHLFQGNVIGLGTFIGTRISWVLFALIVMIYLLALVIF